MEKFYNGIPASGRKQGRASLAEQSEHGSYAPAFARQTACYGVSAARARYQPGSSTGVRDVSPIGAGNGVSAGGLFESGSKDDPDVVRRVPGVWRERSGLERRVAALSPITAPAQSESARIWDG